MLEAILALAIVSIVLVTALHMAGAAAVGRLRQQDRRMGHLLARELMSEVIQTSYEEPDGTPQFGRESGESNVNRADWDDVDDYAGWKESPPQDRAGQAIEMLEGWKRQIEVEKMQWTSISDGTNELVQLVPASDTLPDTGLRRVTVTVLSPSGHPTRITSLRADHRTLEAQPTMSSLFVPQVGLDVQVGPDPAGRVRGGVAVLNHRMPRTAAGGS
jgi:hypothetical protein